MGEAVTYQLRLYFTSGELYFTFLLTRKVTVTFSSFARLFRRSMVCEFKLAAQASLFVTFCLAKK